MSAEVLEDLCCAQCKSFEQFFDNVDEDSIQMSNDPNDWIIWISLRAEIQALQVPDLVLLMIAICGHDHIPCTPKISVHFEHVQDSGLQRAMTTSTCFNKITLYTYRYITDFHYNELTEEERCARLREDLTNTIAAVRKNQSTYGLA